MEVVTKLLDDIDKEFYKDIEYLSVQALNDPKSKRPFNYTMEKIMDAIAVTIGYSENGIPFHLSTVQTRDCFNGMARVMSRFYIPYEFNSEKRTGLRNPTLPFKSGKDGDFVRESTLHLMNQQVAASEICGFRSQFASAQYSTPRIWKRFTKSFNKIGDTKDWICDDKNRYWVCNNNNPYDCAQWIIWRGSNTLKVYNPKI